MLKLAFHNTPLGKEDIHNLAIFVREYFKWTPNIKKSAWCIMYEILRYTVSAQIEGRHSIELLELRTSIIFKLCTILP